MCFVHRLWCTSVCSLTFWSVFWSALCTTTSVTTAPKYSPTSVSSSSICCSSCTPPWQSLYLVVSTKFTLEDWESCARTYYGLGSWSWASKCQLNTAHCLLFSPTGPFTWSFEPNRCSAARADHLLAHVATVLVQQFWLRRSS